MTLGSLEKLLGAVCMDALKNISVLPGLPLPVL